MVSAKPFTLGIVGAGRVTENHHLPVLSVRNDVNIAWICDLDRDKAARLARAYRIGQASSRLADCRDVDAILIAVPVGQRDEIWKEAFGRRWHVFCEKPLAADLAEHQSILRRACEVSVSVGVGFMRRFYPAVGLLRTIVSHRLFGPVRKVWASEGSRLHRSGRDQNWYRTRRALAGGGALIELGCHTVDQALYGVGAADFAVSACVLEYRGEIEHEARLKGIVELADGSRCEMGIAVSQLRDLANQIVVVFDDAELRAGIGPSDSVRLCAPGGATVAAVDAPGARRAAPSDQMYPAFHAEWGEFLVQCRVRGPSRVSADSALLTTKVIDSCYRLAPPPDQVPGEAR